MGVVFSGMFALGIVLYVSIESDAHLDHILFGNMLGIGAQDLWTAGLISAGVGLLLITKWKDWLLHSFDPAQAQASGLWVNWLHYGLLAAMSLTIVATLSAAGLILAIGLLIAPGAIAFLLVRTFSAMLWVSVLVCMASMLIGTYASFFLDSAPAPTRRPRCAVHVAVMNAALRGRAGKRDFHDVQVSDIKPFDQLCLRAVKLRNLRSVEALGDLRKSLG